jgi:hypothetical protein
MDEQGRTVLRRFLAGLLLAVIIFALIWFIFLRDSGKKEAGNQRDDSGKSQPASDERDSGNRAQAKASEDKQPASGSKTNTDTNKAANTGQLTNVGPGNTLALFVSSSVAAGTGHYLYKRRRRVQSS